MTELFVIGMWATVYLTTVARNAFSARLQPVMRKIRQGVVPAMLLVAGFATSAQSHAMPDPTNSGAGYEDRAGIVATRFDGISLDEAVSRAEQQYRARVVRTDVQDEDGRKVYVLKLLSDDGRVFTVRIDAATGRMR
ncbi:MAG: PepSY domain-containing protein [Steroidobacteraceae bacterium]|nr:PepSY domain-containing protein [Steroidobacteraceae bacterium]